MKRMKRQKINKIFLKSQKNLVFLILITIISVAEFEYSDTDVFKKLSVPVGFLGSALAFFIAFINKKGYERWWEAHKIWDKFVSDSRNFALKTITFITNYNHSEKDAADLYHERKVLIYRQIAVMWALNYQLKKKDPLKAVQPFLEYNEYKELKRKKHISLTLLKNQSEHLRQLHEKNYLNSHFHMQFDKIMENFNDAIGKSERIKNTVFPKQYSWYMSYALKVFLLIFPFCLAGHLGASSVPFSIAIGSVFIFLETVGGGIENPFEVTESNFPLDWLSKLVEKDSKAILNFPEQVDEIKMMENNFEEVELRKSKYEVLLKDQYKLREIRE